MNDQENGLVETEITASSASPETPQIHSVPIIVGIGASAGGIESFEAFFSRMPALTGMTFVIIQHLAPQHTSILPDLIQRYTEMPVKLAQNDTTVEPNTVYIIPPNALLGLFNGKLQLLGPTENMGVRLPIDYFFRSLADDMQDRVVGIILSGTGSDGSLGLKAIKEKGGIIMVEDPASAQYDGMPRSAIATGLVDFVLPASAMPEKLTSYKRLAVDAKTNQITAHGKVTSEYLQQILFMIRTNTGHDFSHYKESTMRRRIERLMAMNQIEDIADYARFLQNNTIGIQVLFRDLLIGVTTFFRDKDVFVSLQKSVIPHLFENRHAQQSLRIWVPGCSTGEEAYSIAILLREQMAVLKQEFKVQIFATDIDDQAVNFARTGLYPLNIAQDVPPEYLQQYFFETSNGYQVVKPLREMLVFAQHSVIKDPPFTKLDMISCRNLLIYLDSQLQNKVLSYFHFALAPGGFLILGSSESLGSHEREFSVVDAPRRIYQSSQNGSSARLKIDLSSVIRDLPDIRNMPERSLQKTDRNRPSVALRDIMETMLLNDWTPTCIIINVQGHLRYVHGQTSKYLEITSGSVDQLDIVRSAREGLKIPLTTAIYRAVTQQREIFEPSIRLTAEAHDIYVNLTVKPLTQTIENDNLLAVFFQDVDLPYLLDDAEKESSLSTADEREQKYRLLQQELHDTREYLQATIEELKSTNEEMQSINEELQSANEELETSQEELKAVNEELLTVNTELEENVKELNAANNDLGNTFNTIPTGIILLDMDFRVRRFNSAATQVFKLIPADIGRSIAHVFSEMNYSTLLQDAEQVFHSLIPHVVDVQSKNGSWFALQIRPYRTVQNAIKGVVVSFNDITTNKQTEAIQAARVLAESIFNTVREPLLLLDSSLHIINANTAFFDIFHVSAEETLGQHLTELGQGTWQIPALINLIEAVIQTNTPFQDYEMAHEFPIVGHKEMLINARQIPKIDGQPLMALVAIEEIP